jgi:ribose transport system substrate-binding protein
MRRTQAIIVLLLGTAALVLSGCGPQTAATDNDSDNDSEKPRVALIMKSLANDFFKTMEDGAKAHQQAHPDQYTLVANGIPDERDKVGQMKLIEQAVADKVDAIVIAPADSTALIAPCKRAMEAGVVVVNIDNKFDADVLKQAGTKIPFVGPDNRAGAKKVGEHLASHLKAGDQVAIIEGITTAFNSQQRRQGFEDAMRAAGMEIIQPVQSGEWEIAKANTVAASILNANRELKALLCANDNMAVGAVAAVKAAGRTDDVKVVGFDNIPAVQELLKDGRVLATADQHADQLAVFGIEYALQILKDGIVPEDKETRVDLITAQGER